jgi:hypothetical protein
MGPGRVMGESAGDIDLLESGIVNAVAWFSHRLKPLRADLKQLGSCVYRSDDCPCRILRVYNHVSLLEDTSERAIACEPTIQATELLRYKELLYADSWLTFRQIFLADCRLPNKNNFCDTFSWKAADQRGQCHQTPEGCWQSRLVWGAAVV